jgi:acyl carrier protein
MANLKELTVVFRTVFDDDELILQPEMTANDIDGWDSISHENLLLAVEQRFGIRFTSEEQMRLRNVGDFLECLRQRGA